MKLIVGLGNPGKKYQGTRHNVGFEVIAELSRRFSGGTPRARFQGEAVEIKVAGDGVLLLWPLTYMNNSGECVQPARDFYKLENSQILVVCDDLNLPVAKLRVRSKGSAGGQKGLQDIIRRLGTEEVPRLRIGIGQPPPGWDAANYVLGRFSPEEQSQIAPAVVRAAEAAADWAGRGIEACMNRYNTETEP